MIVERFTLKEVGDELHVTVSLPHADVYSKNNPVQKMHLGTPQVLQMLSMKGVEVGKCIQEDSIRNFREYSRTGTWIFEKKKLDKTPEPAIIKEEKSVQPKPTRKKRTRSSTKKVSTED